MANARLQGLQEDVLRGSDTNYSIALSCFFVRLSPHPSAQTVLIKSEMLRADHLHRLLHSWNAARQDDGPLDLHRLRRSDLEHLCLLSSCDTEPCRTLRL